MILSPTEARQRQLRINAILRQDQTTGHGNLGIGSQPTSIPEISRAPKRSPKQGALAKKRAARSRA